MFLLTAHAHIDFIDVKHKHIWQESCVHILFAISLSLSHTHIHSQMYSYVFIYKLGAQSFPFCEVSKALNFIY